jgi:hypothetical protein
MNDPRLALLFQELFRPSAETIREKLREFDASPVGHVVMEVTRARLHGELEKPEDLIDVLHRATRPKPPTEP